MERNYLTWKRPEGHYKDRDDLFIAVVPTRHGRAPSVDRAPVGPHAAPAEEDRQQHVLGRHPGGVAERDRQDAERPDEELRRERRRRRARRTRR